MRSIAGAMAWELTTRWRWQLLGTAFGMFALPILILASMGNGAAMLGQNGDVTNQVLGFCFLQANILTIVIPLIALCTSMRGRLYSYPATTATLAHGLMLPATAIVAIDLVVWTAAMNTMFRLQWPAIEPAIFAVAITIATFSAMWLTYQSRWAVVALTVVAGTFSFWIKSHFGPIFGEMTHPWQPMTATEAILLLIVTATSYRFGLRAFARSRRGERPFSTGLINRLEAFSERRVQTVAKFATPLAAQSWYFQQRSWVAPAVVLSVSAFSITLWLFVNRDVGALVEACAVGAGLLCIATAIGGLYLGALGMKEQTNIGQFLASRPITSVDMAWRLLLTAAKSFLQTWACWGVICVLIVLFAQLTENSPMEHLPPAHRWELLVGAVLLSWAAMTTTMVMALADRGRLIFRVITGLSFSFIALIILNSIVVRLFDNAQIVHTFGALFGLAATAATVAAFYYAFRRGLLEPRLAIAAVVVWVILIAAGAGMIPRTSQQDRTIAGMKFFDVTARTFVLGSLSLAVAPIAATPLALAYNRTR